MEAMIQNNNQEIMQYKSNNNLNSIQTGNNPKTQKNLDRQILKKLGKNYIKNIALALQNFILDQRTNVKKFVKQNFPAQDQQYFKAEKFFSKYAPKNLKISNRIQFRRILLQFAKQKHNDSKFPTNQKIKHLQIQSKFETLQPGPENQNPNNQLINYLQQFPNYKVCLSKQKDENSTFQQIDKNSDLFTNNNITKNKIVQNINQLNQQNIQECLFNNHKMCSSTSEELINNQDSTNSTEKFEKAEHFNNKAHSTFQQKQFFNHRLQEKIFQQQQQQQYQQQKQINIYKLQDQIPQKTILELKRQLRQTKQKPNLKSKEAQIKKQEIESKILRVFLLKLIKTNLMQYCMHKSRIQYPEYFIRLKGKILSCLY